jgi:hypothetical protein
MSVQEEQAKEIMLQVVLRVHRKRHDFLLFGCKENKVPNKVFFYLQPNKKKQKHIRCTSMDHELNCMFFFTFFF